MELHNVPLLLPQSVHIFGIYTNTFYLKKWKVAVEYVICLLCTWEVLDSNLDPETGCTKDLHDFPHVHDTDAGIIHQTGPQLLLSHPIQFLPFDAI
jgi:hypothetical protein